MSSELFCLRANGLQIGHRGVALLPPLDMEIGPQHCWGIIGRNGAGKTTLLRTLLGLLPPVQGRVERRPKLQISYVSQRFAAYPDVPGRVVDIVTEGWDRKHSFWWPHKPVVRRQALAALEEVGIAHLAHTACAHLSEGQKQRAWLARAVISQPDVLVLDEPTSAMDEASERAVFELLHRLRRTHAMAVVVVGHHVAMLAAHTSHMAVVDVDTATVSIGPTRHVLAAPAVQKLYGPIGPGPQEGFVHG